MSRSMVPQVMAQDDLFLFTIETDHKVAFGIIPKRFTLASRSDRGEVFYCSGRPSSRPSLPFEDPGASSKKTANVLFQSPNILLASPIKHFYLLPELFDLIGRQCSQYWSISCGTNNLLLIIDSMLRQSNKRLTRFEQWRVPTTDQQEPNRRISSDIHYHSRNPKIGRIDHSCNRYSRKTHN